MRKIASPASEAPERPRPRVLAYPSPTTSRFAILIVALLSSGAFVGNLLHNQLLQDRWTEAVGRCLRQTEQLASSPPSGRAQVDPLVLEQRCLAATERRRAAFAFGGAAVAGVAGLLVMMLAPLVIERRRGLRPLVGALRPAGERVAALAVGAGVRAPPRLMLGPATLRDAFSYGVPGRYRMALPPALAVRWRDERLFDPLIRHELAHLRHRDVALAWGARSIWYALGPLLLAPVVVALATGDASFVGDYAWRLVLLAVTVQLTVGALLRSREHDADLAAATEGQDALARVVATAREVDGGRWYGALIAKHPSPARRLQVVERPELIAGVTLLDGFAAAFLAAIAMPIFAAALAALLSGSGRAGTAATITAIVAGSLLGGAVGLGTWRAALVGRVSDRGTSAAPAALGVGAGLVAGQLTSLGQTATTADDPIGLAVVALLGIGVTVLAAGLGELWADAAPAWRAARPSWIIGAGVNALLFAAVIWLARSLYGEIASGGWPSANAWLLEASDSWLVLTAITSVAAVALWALVARRGDGGSPSWMVERGLRSPWHVEGSGLCATVSVGVTVGLVVAGTLAAFWELAGPGSTAGERQQRAAMVPWTAAAAAAAAMLALAVLRGRGGVGSAALAAPLACSAAFLSLEALHGAGVAIDTSGSGVGRTLAIGFAVSVAVAAAGLAGHGRAQRPRRLPQAAAVTGLLVAVAFIAGRDVVVASPPVSPLSLAEATTYVGSVAPLVDKQIFAIENAAKALEAVPTADPETRSARVAAEVIAPLHGLLAAARTIRPASPQTRSAHSACLAALRAATEKAEAFAVAFRTGSRDAEAQVARYYRQEQRWWRVWRSRVLDLRDVVRGA